MLPALGLTGAALVSAPAPLHAQESHVLVVEGLAGTPEMGESFRRWSTRLVDASVDRFGLLSDNVVYLAPDPEADPDRIDGESTAEEKAAQECLLNPWARFSKRRSAWSSRSAPVS